MSVAAIKIILTYLLLPLIAILLGAVIMVVAKKNKLLSNKKFIVYFLLSFIILAIPGLLGFSDYFMPYIYVLLQLLYLVLGYYNMRIQKALIKDFDEKPYYVHLLLSFVIMFVGGALFSVLFNLFNELKIGVWACTCVLPFIFPVLFSKAYKTYMDIPLEIYKTWRYQYMDADEEKEPAQSPYNKILVVELELLKDISDNKLFSIKAKAPDTMIFGEWVQLFIDDYNKKSPQSPIIFEDTEERELYDWIFYSYTSILRRRRYIDPELSFEKNKMREENTIIAKRVKQLAMDNEELRNDN